ncbi:MAG: hypothetical protein AAF288_12015 [Planctomycetota bacterium]
MSDLDQLRQRADALDAASQSRRQRKRAARAELDLLRQADAPGTRAPTGIPGPPAGGAVPPADALPAQRLHDIATWQRHGLNAVLLQLIVFPIVFAAALVVVLMNLNQDQVLIPIILLLMLQFAVGWLYGEVAAYRLHRALGAGPAMAWAYVILGLLPLAEWILLFQLNLKATRILKRHGVKIGFMGAKRRTLPTIPPNRSDAMFGAP